MKDSPNIIMVGFKNFVAISKLDIFKIPSYSILSHRYLIVILYILKTQMLT